MNRLTRLLGDAPSAVAQTVTPASVKTVAKAPSLKLEVLHQPLKTSIAPGVVAGAVGAYGWEKHRVLGFFAGEAVGANAYSVVKGSSTERRNALCNVASTGAAVAGSLAWKKHPVWGFILGGLAGSVATNWLRK